MWPSHPRRSPSNSPNLGHELGTDIELDSELGTNVIAGAGDRVAELGTENTGRGIAEKGIEVILEVVST